MASSVSAAPYGITGGFTSSSGDFLDIDSYFPLDRNRCWGFRFTRQRRNGETLIDELHWRLLGQREINGKSVWMIGDEAQQVLFVSIDDEGIQHHGDAAYGQDEEICYPPLTTVSRFFSFRQPQSSVYRMTKGQNQSVGFFVHQMTGFETLNLPAGIFKDCLRTESYFQREGGGCFTTETHYAPGVGIVRYSFRQIDPAANAIVVVGIKELSYVKLDGAE